MWKFFHNFRYAQIKQASAVGLYTLYLNAQEKADFVWDCTGESVTL